MSSKQWISFQVESEAYVHSVDTIKEIIPYTPPVPVPGTPACTEGILNVRGNVVTIMSGRSLFDEKESKQPEEKRIIILEHKSELIGVSVDSVGEIITFQSDQVEWLEQGRQLQLIKGTLHLDNQLYILTDFTDYSCGKRQENA